MHMLCNRTIRPLFVAHTDPCKFFYTPPRNMTVMQCSLYVSSLKPQCRNFLVIGDYSPDRHPGFHQANIKHSLAITATSPAPSSLFIAMLFFDPQPQSIFGLLPGLTSINKLHEQTYKWRGNGASTSKITNVLDSIDAWLVRAVHSFLGLSAAALRR